MAEEENVVGGEAMPQETPERRARLEELFQQMDAEEAARTPGNIGLIGQTLRVRLAASAHVLHTAEILGTDLGFLKLRLLDVADRIVWVPTAQIMEMREPEPDTET